jgi:hypothetical protein
MAYFLNYKNIIGVEFVLKKWKKVHPIGKLLYHHEDDSYTFQYYPEYIVLDNMPQLTTELFLDTKIYKSKKLFTSFNWFIADELSTTIRSWKTPIQRLCEIKIPVVGVSAFPIYNLEFTSTMFLNWCKEMELNLLCICSFFDISRSLVKNMRVSKKPNSGKDTLKRLSLYYFVPEAFEFLLDTRGYFLNEKQLNAALKWKENHFAKPYNLSKQ